jgi:predicted nicotinamide N-methyase
LRTPSTVVGGKNEGVETLVETVALPGLTLQLERPHDPESLVSEEAFEDDEFLPYWADLWPSGIALASHVASRAVAGLRVLELGCGLGLPSLVAAANGSHVLATDWARDAIALLRSNAARNGLLLEAAQADWREPGSLDLGGFDLVLAADVLYEERNGGPLLSLLEPFLAEGGEVLIADPGRRHAAAFLIAASARCRIETIAHPAIQRGGVHVLHGTPRSSPA